MGASAGSGHFPESDKNVMKLLAQFARSLLWSKGHVGGESQPCPERLGLLIRWSQAGPGLHDVRKPGQEGNDLEPLPSPR